MSSIRASVLALAGLLVAAGCAKSRGPESAGSTLVTLPGGAADGSDVTVDGRWCVRCHGDAARAVAATDAAGIAFAPPADVAGATTGAKVGAHQAHLRAGAFRGAGVPCGSCHVTPATADAHVPGVIFKGLAAITWSGTPIAPSWNATAGSCTSTYCHGNFRSSGVSPTVTWTGPASSVTCGSCHLTPPANGAHAALTPAPGNLTQCVGCHTDTMNADGTLNLASGTHINGLVEGGESGGGIPCGTCHSAIVAGMTGAATSQHALTSDSPAFQTTITWGAPLSGNAVAVRSCTNMCHDDHPHTAAGAGDHSYNVYEDANARATAASTSTRAKTDFDAGTNAGLCVSCHQFASANTVAIPGAAFGASAHASTTTSDGTTTWTWRYALHLGTFDRNCTKCHASATEGTTPTAGATGSSTAAVHFNANPTLLAGKTNPAGTAAGFVCYNCHGSAATPANGAQGNRSGVNLQSLIAKASNHPVTADAVHDTGNEYANALFGNALGGVARHVNCLDCHAPHAAQGGDHVGSFAGPPLQGGWGAALSSNPAFWTAPASGNFTKTAAAGMVAGTDLEATLCFKCHSAFYGTLPISPSSVGLPSPVAAGGFTETDAALEFNPANAGNWKTAGTANQYDGGETAGSYHPVLADCSSNLGAINLPNLVTTNIAWSTTTRNRMTCTDCHGTDTVTDPVGPHGSAAKFILRGPNTVWTQGTVGSTSGIFCWNCHSSSYANSRFSAHGTHETSVVVPCMNCHVAIVHGSMRPGLLSAGNGGCGVTGGTTCGPTSMNINVGGPVVACANGNGAGTNCLATDNPPYNQAGTAQNKLRLAYYPANATTNWGSTTAFCGCGNVIGGQGH